MRPEEVAQELRLGRSAVYELLGSGRLESLKIGRRRLIPREALVAFIQRESASQRDDVEAGP